MLPQDSASSFSVMQKLFGSSGNGKVGHTVWLSNRDYAGVEAGVRIVRSDQRSFGEHALMLPKVKHLLACGGNHLIDFEVLRIVVMAEDNDSGDEPIRVIGKFFDRQLGDAVIDLLLERFNEVLKAKRHSVVEGAFRQKPLLALSFCVLVELARGQ